MPDGIISAILQWLRSGYPEGVPTTDYFPLLALLRNSLTEEEYAEVVDRIERYHSDPIRVSTIRRAIEQVTTEVPNEEEVRQVAARLASAGWPLSSRARHLADVVHTRLPDEVTVGDVESGKYDDVIREGVAEEAELGLIVTAAGDEFPELPELPKSGVVRLALEWLRAGYPEGIPPKDYTPILALLSRRLSDDEVREVVRGLVRKTDPSETEVSRIDAQVLMTKVLGDLPSDADIARVKKKLESSGFTML
ncbi:MAG: DUF3349 domain-containing protein [Ancrocorticia sp.]